ncbi:class I adenylate-forming enzyme family protein [Cryptosporangium arvum]|uniref:class I adenylate-forming enzyme family protein n=1 Tax=Cryptosporangium arvum TaxID=80871 RepID=UPI0004B57116|nr:AMP-binding protein [Cryptosporangium arvum]
MSAKPWLAHYGEGRPAELTPDHETMLDLFRASLARAPGTEVIRYFDGVLTLAELDRASDALASALLDRGFAAGDRIALYLQNDPAFVIGLVAAWKAGGIAVAINPMNRHRELTYLLTDAGASALLCLDELYADVGRAVVASGATDVRIVITASALDRQQRIDPRLFAHVTKPVIEDASDLETLLEQYDGRTPPPVDPAPDDVAILTYTSGTTGVPKGALNTHRNLAFNAQTYRDWMALTPADRILGVAPLFHITGLVGHIGIALLLPAPLVLAHRFHPGVVLDAIREHRPTFTVAAITVFISLADQPDATSDDFASLTIVYSGGAPIAPAVRDRIAAATGLNIHNIYGLTETNSPSHGVPYGARAPVDPTSGALSIGVPVFNTDVRVLGEDGAEVPVGEVGEFAIRGPQVVPGYWNKPDATAESIPGGELRTGDVGFMDSDGWFYLVDRKKDMINAAGYKVWPREVEDVLYTHPAVREAAVVGVPDEYRGETVKAFVSLRPGASATPDELVEFCRATMAAYKYPRIVEFVDELPKTTTGKILRRELRPPR